MINGDLLALLAAERIAELHRAAQRARVAATARPHRPAIRLRLGRVTVLIERGPVYSTRPSASRPT
jgi:hypothetical protein